MSHVRSMLERFWVRWDPKQPPTTRFHKELKCRCNTNDRETTSAIDGGKQLDMDFTSKIEGKSAASAKLSTEEELAERHRQQTATVG